MFRLLYDTALQSYHVGIRAAALFNPKASKWISGRNEQDISSLKLLKPIWIHCASLGEFEQGRPIIEKLRLLYPDQHIVLTFFSPSGFEIRKEYNQVNEVLYLPLDQKQDARDFVDVIDPSLVIFVKYDFWYHYLSTLADREIPYIVIAANFPAGHFLFRSMLKPLLALLRSAECIFVQSEESLQNLTSKDFTNVRVAGDPRVDRVLSKTPDSTICSELDLAPYSQVIVFGSLWLEDLDIVASWIKQSVTDTNTFVIIAPHDISEKTQRLIEHSTGISTRLSQLRTSGTLDAKGLIVDTIGDLSSLYHCATLAYVGGGFGHGIHNILEPAAAHIPILFGPKHSKFPEAKDLIDLHCAFTVESKTDVAAALDHLQDQSTRAKIKKDIQQYLQINQGATDMIVAWLQAHNLVPA